MKPHPLPDRLKNMQISYIAPGEKVEVLLSDRKLQSLEEILYPTVSKSKGA
jgi:hypothetical protein